MYSTKRNNYITSFHGATMWCFAKGPMVTHHTATAKQECRTVADI